MDTDLWYYKDQDFDLIHSSGWRAGEADVVRVEKKLVMMVKNRTRAEEAVHMIDSKFVDLFN